MSVPYQSYISKFPFSLIVFRICDKVHGFQDSQVLFVLAASQSRVTTVLVAPFELEIICS